MVQTFKLGLVMHTLGVVIVGEVEGGEGVEVVGGGGTVVEGLVGTERVVVVELGRFCVLVVLL